jgi:imidazolonepropionase-like amidohydrolase
MTRGTNPTTAQYSAEELKAAVEEAHRVGRRVVAHAHGAPGVRNAILAGMDTIEHCKWMTEMRGRQYEPRLRQELGEGASYWKPPGRDMDAQLVQQMAEQGTVVDLTFASPRRMLIPRDDMTAEEQQACRAELRELHEHYGLMKESGVTVIVSSDAGAAGTKFEEFALGPLGAVEAGIMTPMEAVEAVTRLAAEAIGLQDEIGTVEPGKCADLIVVDGNPLADLRALGRVVCVVEGGRPVVRDGAMVREWAEADW